MVKMLAKTLLIAVIIISSICLAGCGNSTTATKIIKLTQSNLTPSTSDGAPITPKPEDNSSGIIDQNTPDGFNNATIFSLNSVVIKIVSDNFGSSEELFVDEISVKLIDNNNKVFYKFNNSYLGVSNFENELIFANDAVSTSSFVSGYANICTVEYSLALKINNKIVNFNSVKATPILRLHTGSNIVSASLEIMLSEAVMFVVEAKFNMLNEK